MQGNVGHIDLHQIHVSKEIFKETACYKYVRFWYVMLDLGKMSTQ